VEVASLKEVEGEAAQSAARMLEEVEVVEAQSAARPLAVVAVWATAAPA
jgi:hypothetical protein